MICTWSVDDLFRGVYDLTRRNQPSKERHPPPRASYAHVYNDQDFTTPTTGRYEPELEIISAIDGNRFLKKQRENKKIMNPIVQANLNLRKEGARSRLSPFNEKKWKQKTKIHVLSLEKDSINIIYISIVTISILDFRAKFDRFYNQSYIGTGRGGRYRQSTTKRHDPHPWGHTNYSGITHLFCPLMIGPEAPIPPSVDGCSMEKSEMCGPCVLFFPFFVR